MRHRDFIKKNRSERQYFKYITTSLGYNCCICFNKGSTKTSKPFYSDSYAFDSFGFAYEDVFKSSLWTKIEENEAKQLLGDVIFARMISQR